MSLHLHARKRAVSGGRWDWRFRFWDSKRGVYETDELVEEEARGYMRQSYPGSGMALLNARMDRAKAQGTSVFGERVPLDGEWCPETHDVASASASSSGGGGGTEADTA